MNTLSKWNQAQRASNSLIMSEVDLMKLNFESIDQDLKEGSADNWRYFDHIGELIERLEEAAVLLRDNTESERATNIRIMKWKMANPMDEMFSRPWEIDYALNEDAY